jgi:HK97 gp10 family phage protein
MANFGSIKVEGIEAATEALRKVGDALGPEHVQDCLLVGAELIRDRAKQLVKIGPGLDKNKQERVHLKNAIFAVRGKQNPAAPSVIAGVSVKRAPHAHLVEYGHDLWKGGSKRAGTGHFIKFVAARPFLRPALDQSKNDIPDLVADKIKQLLRSFGIGGIDVT